MFEKTEYYARYSRHLLLPEVGVIGQLRLLDASVLIVGIGGLGSPVAIYLAAAGVGTLGLIEHDHVDISNLQRQILYASDQIGMSKVEIAAKRLKAINPHAVINTYKEPLNSENALNIFRRYDYIIDATDNFATRYLINDACVILRKTYVYGSIFDFEGQLMVLGAPEGPCYRCVFPEPPTDECIPGYLDKGVFGVLPGVVGSIQATETIKLICKIGRPIIGKLLIFDALEMKLRELRIEKNSNCPTCSGFRINELGDYSHIKSNEPHPDIIERTSYDDLINRIEAKEELILLDVRDDCECEMAEIDNALHIPLLKLRENIFQLNPHKEKKIIVVCQTGHRALAAAMALQAMDYRKTCILEGGLNALSESNDALHILRQVCR